MAESINDIAIKLGVDAEGVRVGFQRASSYVLSWGRDYEAAVAAANRVAIIQSQQHDAHVQKRKQVEDEFNTWYRKELDKEFQVWYENELKKEKIVQDRVAAERQAAINTYNVQHGSPQFTPAESPERIKEMDDLRRAIENRYEQIAVIELEARGQHDAHVESWIKTNQDWLRAEEERVKREETLAFRARRIYGEDDPYDNPNDRAARRAAMNARRQADVDALNTFAAAEREAGAIVRQNMSLMDRYNESLARINYLRTLAHPVTHRMALSEDQARAAITRLTIATIRQQQAQAALNQHVNQTADVGRIMTGVMSQAAFAAEDFIQGLVFGDIRSALLGASNNMTMVVRGLMQANQAAGGLSATLTTGLVVGGTVVGLGALAAALIKVHSAARDMRSLSQFLSEAAYGIGIFDAGVRRLADSLQHARNMSKINSSSEAFDAMLKMEDDLLIKQRELQNAQREAALEGAATVEHMLGGTAARLELERQIQKTIDYGWASEVAAAKEAQRLLRVADEQAKLGNAENTIQALRELHQLLSEGQLYNWTEWLDDLSALDSLQEYFNPNMMGAFFEGMGEDLEKIREVKEALRANYEKMNDLQQQEADIALRILDIQQRRLELLERERVLRFQMRVLDQEEMNAFRRDLLNQGSAPSSAMQQKLDAEKRISELLSQSAGMALLGGAGGQVQWLLDLQIAQQHLQLINEELQKQQVIQQQLHALKMADVQAQRDEMLFLITATTAQKNILELKKQQQALLAPSAGLAGLGGGLGAMGLGAMGGAMQMAQDMAFNMMWLQAHEQRLNQARSDLLQQNSPQFQEGLMQDAWAARGSAMKQMLEADFRKRDPQLDAIEKELQAIRTAIANGGIIQQVP